MIINPEKSLYMCLGKNLDNNEVLNFNNLTIKSSKEVEILQKQTDIIDHIISLCRKAGQKLTTVLRTSSNLNMKQNKFKNQ